MKNFNVFFVFRTVVYLKLSIIVTSGWQSAALGSFLYTFSFVVGYIAVKYNFYLYYGVAVLMAVGVTLATIGALTEAIKWVPRWEGMVRIYNF